MTDIPDIVDVIVGTPLGTTDHCFVCVLRVEQFVPEYNVKSTNFLKYRTNWDSVRSAVRSLSWSTILKSADPLVRAIELLVRSLLGMFLPLFCVVNLETSNGLMPEFMILNRLLIVPGVEHTMLNI